MATMILGVPGSLALGAPVPALLLKLSWCGLKGWQWLFLVEGAPAVVLGCSFCSYCPTARETPSG